MKENSTWAVYYGGYERDSHEPNVVDRETRQETYIYIDRRHITYYTLHIDIDIHDTRCTLQGAGV